MLTFPRFLLDLGSISGKTGVALELDDVNVCQGSIKIWETNRNRLHAQLQKLREEDTAVCSQPHPSSR